MMRSRTTRPALGLRSGKVTIVPYDDRWPELFGQASAELRRALGEAILAVHHVGSTAVPGLCAKPVLDILASVPQFERATDLISQLGSLGYELRPDDDIPDRLFFRRSEGHLTTHHLSLAEPSSRHHVAALAFRDALRSDVRAAKAYEELKLRLAEEFPRDRESYMRGKTDFVLGTIANAAERG